VRILLIESDSELGDALAAGLRLDGHLVEHVTALTEGLRALTASPWDVCVADVTRRSRRWPGPLERAATRALAAHAPTVLTTTHGWVEDVHPRDVGADALMRKPFPIAALRRVVARVAVARSTA